MIAPGWPQADSEHRSWVEGFRMSWRLDLAATGLSTLPSDGLPSVMSRTLHVASAASAA
jgi:hypothetical protein